MAGFKAGKAFNDRIDEYLAFNDDEILHRLQFVFLPPEIENNWDGQPPLEDIRAYLTAWWRALASYVKEWRNAYNAAKHGLAAGVRPSHIAFLRAEGDGPPVDLMRGPVMRTLEHEFVKDADGRRVKDPRTDKYALRWFWMNRAIDPDELIAQTIVTADLLDWLRAVAGARLLGRTGVAVHVRDEPKPATLRRRTAPGISFRMDLAAVPLPPDEAAKVWARAQGDDEDEPDMTGGDKPA
jgi:hypothetical protein